MIKTLTLTAALALGLAGVAAAQPHPPARRHGDACFWRQDVENFAAHDPSTLYLRVGVDQVWALSLMPNCLELPWVHRVGLKTEGMSDICEGPNPNVDVIIHGLGTGGHFCPVTYARKLTPAEVAALPKDARP